MLMSFKLRETLLFIFKNQWRIIVSIFSLIISAGLVVKAVMLILVLMSVYSWTLILSKKKILLDVNRDIKTFNREFDGGFNFEESYTKISNIADSERTPMQRIFAVGYDEFTHFEPKTNKDAIIHSERAYRCMNTALNNKVDELDDGLSILAMIASSSPYIGLFGTVWGIMHSFIGLASVKQATIAIVAPGIAEALIATAFGLFAAIPATIAYNRLSSQVSQINNKYTAFIEKMFVIFQK